MLGVVLAGGESRRMGEDKVRMAVHGAGGPDMLERTAKLLATCTDEVCVSARASRDAGPYRLIPDEIEDLGPLGGVYSVLRQTEEAVLVLSCDLPFMNRQTLQRLIDAHARREPGILMTTFRQAETGFTEALVSIYEPGCRPYFEEAQKEGIRQINQVIPSALQKYVLYTKEENLPFFNINYPADVKLAQKIAGAQQK